MLPLTPKSRRIFSKNSGSLFSFLLKSAFSFLDGIFNKSIDGTENFVFFEKDSPEALINGRSSCIKFFISS